MSSDSAYVKDRLIAKTLSGLEETLAEELTALGAQDVWPTSRAVEFSGDTALLYKVHLWCRTATRILKPIATFQAADSDELYRAVGRIDWSQYLEADSTLAIDAVAIDSGFANSMFVSQRAKDAIVDQLRARTGKRPSVDTADPDLRLNVHIHGPKATLSLDASGEPLGRRGYRIEGGKAPLGEVLAAGIVRLTEWDMASPLIDPMCGSGTIIIEAAMMARDLAPGLRRRFGFMRWKDYDAAIFKRLHQEALAAGRPRTACEIVGSDIDRRALAEAKANAERAGVADDIRFEQKTFENQRPPQPPGVMVANPPYGERMAMADINAFYTGLGDALKRNYQGYAAFILTGNPDAAKHIGLRTSRRIKLFNGPIECRLLRFELYQGSRKRKYTPPDS